MPRLHHVLGRIYEVQVPLPKDPHLELQRERTYARQKGRESGVRGGRRRGGRRTIEYTILHADRAELLEEDEAALREGCTGVCGRRHERGHCPREEEQL